MIFLSHFKFEAIEIRERKKRCDSHSSLTNEVELYFNNDNRKKKRINVYSIGQEFMSFFLEAAQIDGYFSPFFLAFYQINSSFFSNGHFSPCFVVAFKLLFNGF